MGFLCLQGLFLQVWAVSLEFVSCALIISTGLSMSPNPHEYVGSPVYAVTDVFVWFPTDEFKMSFSDKLEILMCPRLISCKSSPYLDCILVTPSAVPAKLSSMI